MNGLSDIYFLDSDIMFLTPFVGQRHGSTNNRQEDLRDTTDHKLSNLEQIVQLNDDVYEIVPVDPLGPGCSSYNSIQPPVPYSYVTDGQQVNEGLAVLEILYNHPLDAPEYIDINDLASVRSCHDSPPVIEVPPDEEDDDDDDDDVIFVGEYNKADGASGEGHVSSKSSAPAPRRNPVRKARRNARDIAKELLYDEEYAILESSSEDDVINETLKKSVKNSTLSLKDYKKWPVSGLHERPEYNDSTKQLEKFDYTIRQIKNSVAPKKSPAKITRKPPKKRKYYARRKIPVKINVEERVPVTDLQELVESTFQDVRQYIENLRISNDIFRKSGKNTEDESKNCDNNKESVCSEDSSAGSSSSNSKTEKAEESEVSLSSNVKNQVVPVEDKKDCMNSVETTFHCNTTLENTSAKNDFMSMLELGFKFLMNERQCCSRDFLDNYKSVEISKRDDSASFKKPSDQTTQLLLRRRRLTQRNNLSTQECVKTSVPARSNKRLLKDVRGRNYNSHSSINEADYKTSSGNNLDVFRKPSPKVTKWLLHKRKYNLRNKPVADVDTQEKVPAIELKELVQSTYDDVRQFVKNIRISNEILNRHAENSEINGSKSENYHVNEAVPSTSGIVTSTNQKSKAEVTTMSDTMLKSLELLENQAVLFQVISNAEEKNVMKYFKHMQ